MRRKGEPGESRRKRMECWAESSQCPTRICLWPRSLLSASERADLHDQCVFYLSVQSCWIANTPSVFKSD
jgi:hypothetical protein